VKAGRCCRHYQTSTVPEQTGPSLFNKLRLPDVPGTPALAEAGGERFREIVGALHGSVKPSTRERMIRGGFLLAPKKSSERDCLAHAIGAAHRGLYDLAQVEARTAITPIAERSKTYKAPVSPPASAAGASPEGY
jgi:hypothetical protein